MMRDSSRTESLSTDQERMRQQQRALLGALKTVNAERADLEWTLAELEQQLAALHSEGDDPTVARRINDLRRWRSTLEDRVLRHMYRAEELEAEIGRLRAQLA
jgi:predicted  nucleic acid-binding Zn-ribbon protein